MNRRAFFKSLTVAALGSTGLASTPPLRFGSGQASEAVGERCGPEMTAAERRRRSRFLNVVLRTHENKAVRFYDDLIRDKFVLINFMYTGCLDDCPLTTANLVQVQKLLRARLGRDLFIYSITVDPAHDTPQVLRAYARRFRVGPGWLFLTGTPMAIAGLRRAFGDNPRLEPGESDHLGVIRYGIEPLERWESCPALTPPESIARYITWLKPKKQGIGVGV